MILPEEENSRAKGDAMVMTAILYHPHTKLEVGFFWNGGCYETDEKYSGYALAAQYS
jgi:hypothetical protein